jgi:hypothetical protein
VHDQYGGDLRGLGESHDVDAARKLLKEFKGIGDTGADIFLREVQDIWTWVRPFFDDRATAAAKELGLPSDGDDLAKLGGDRCAALAAALVRVSLDDGLRDKIRR